MIEQLQRDPRKRKSPMLKQLIEARPNLTPKMNMALSAFNSISRRRGYAGQYATPLPISEDDVISYINTHGCDCYESDILINIIITLDNEWLKLDAERRKRESN